MPELSPALIKVLEDYVVIEIKRLKKQGFTNVAIAKKLGISERTVRRRLNK